MKFKSFYNSDIGNCPQDIACLSNSDCGNIGYCIENRTIVR